VTMNGLETGEYPSSRPLEKIVPGAFWAIVFLASTWRFSDTLASFIPRSREGSLLEDGRN
jgi:hypothetical protein